MEDIKTYTTITEHEIRVHEVRLQNGIPKSWNIKYSNPVSLPQKLVKYYSANENGLKVLKNGKIWATHPFDFNDPYDCSIQMWDIESFPYNDMKHVIEDFIFFGKNVDLNIYETRKLYFTLILRMIGIYCLNENTKSDLFWGYYNNHKGYSIEFNTELLNSSFQSIPYKIEYKDFEMIDKIILRPEDIENNEFYAKILRWITFKKKAWSHENEWRYLFMDINLGNTNRERPFPIDAINEIILGYKFFPQENYEHLDESSTKYFFKSDPEFRYSIEILKWLFENGNIVVKRVMLKEDFTLVNQRIYIKDISGNDVTIFHFKE
jgi:hypothetical protein